MAFNMVTKWCSLLVCIVAFHGLTVADQYDYEGEEVTSISDTTIESTTLDFYDSTTVDSPTTEEPPKEPTEEPPKEPTETPSPAPTTPPISGPLPDEEYPDVDDDDARKEIDIEICVLDNGECNLLPDSDKCNTFSEHFVSQVWVSYNSTISGLANITVRGFRNTTAQGFGILSTFIIIEHEVSYIWNDMDDADRGLSAEELYEKTIAADVAEGKIGNLTVSATCDECQAPEETTSLCDGEVELSCATRYFYGVCLDGVPTCRSECLNSYCGKNGICTHTEVKPLCGCLHNTETLYFGEQCQFHLDKLWFIIGVSIGGFVVILLISILCVCLVISRRNKSKGHKQGKSPLPVEEELGMQNYGYTNEEYDPTQSSGNGIVFHTTGERPYSYLYSNGHADPNVPRKSSFGSTIAQEAAQKQAEKHKNTAFWGNLNESGNGGAGTEMQPALLNLDTSQGYRIQRPKSVTSSLPDPDYDV